MEYNSLLKLPSNDVFPDNRLYHMSEKTLKFSALHWHEYYEMEFVLSGHAVEIVNGVSYAIGPGTVTLLSPVDFHAYHEIDPNNPLVFRISFCRKPFVMIFICTKRLKLRRSTMKSLKIC